MVREMKPEDTSAVAFIEKVCFTEAWSLESVLEGLNSNLDTWLVVETEEGTLAGYCAFRIIADEGELLRIAVLPIEQGRGLAKKLMDHMVEYSRKKEVKSMVLEVRESNLKAQNLYKSYGFFTESIRKNYYRKPSENAVLMRTNRI